jgi:cell division protein FtsI/penicillin-binding protein 2
MRGTEAQIYAPIERRQDGRETVSVIQRRIVVAAGICVMAFALIGVRLVDVGIMKGGVTGASVPAGEQPQSARADIVDRNGVVLARDLPVSDLYARPHAFTDRREAARHLAAEAHPPDDGVGWIVIDSVGFPRPWHQLICHEP